MTWINRKDQEPCKDLKCILVWGSICDCPHIAFRDYEDWIHVEYCNEDHPGWHSSGVGIEFEYWQHVPERPFKHLYANVKVLDGPVFNEGK